MNLERLRKDFPILKRKVNGKPLVYLDSAATSQKPVSVLKAMDDFYRFHNANVHRGRYALSEEASEKFDAARRRVGNFVDASFEETIFTRNTTESINLLAFSLFHQGVLKKGSRVLLSKMEHHANLVPWIELKKRAGIVLDFVPVSKSGELNLSELDTLLRKKPSVVSFSHCSNVLGTINPVREMARAAHAQGALVIVDGAQSVPHFSVDFKKMGADFLAFSAHKMLGPTGIGVLVGKKEHLEKLPPFLTGGEMISEVFWDRVSWNVLPFKFEAGTPAVAEAVGWGTAVDYLEKVGMDSVHAFEQKIGKKAFAALSDLRGVELYGPVSSKKAALFSFNVRGIHPHDVATVLDSEGVAVRSGNHCAQPLLRELGIENSVRASFYLYNTEQEIVRLVNGIEKAKKIFGC